MPRSLNTGDVSPHLVGIATLRFWFALWVYFSHFGLLPFALWIGNSTPFRHVVSGLVKNLFNGSAAVIGFFLISGFCIHFPYLSKPVALLPFYSRRYIRILLPLSAALALSRLVDKDLEAFYRAILWSLIAEEIYYAIYPILWTAIRRFGFQLVLTCSYLLAFGLIASNPHALNFHQFGPALTWIVGLPSWLLGCCLAETLRNTDHPVTPIRRILTYRLIIWLCASFASALRFHAGIGYPLTLTAMGPLLYYWIRAELTLKRRWSIFEYAGKFSYSIYLMHGVAASLVGFLISSPADNSGFASVLRLLLVLAISYGFFRVVEQPSHQCARYVARSVGSFTPGIPVT